MKRAFSVILCLAVILPLLCVPVTVSAEDPYTIAVDYNANHSSFSEALGNTSLASAYVLKITGAKALTTADIATIAANAPRQLVLNLSMSNFENNIVPESAFESASWLLSINLPLNTVRIGKNAFRSCAALISAGLNVGLEEIGESAFDQCISLRYITLPETVTKIGALAFNYCTSMKSVLAMRQKGSSYNADTSAFFNTSSFLTLVTGSGALSYDEGGFSSIPKRVQWNITRTVDTLMAATGTNVLLTVDITGTDGKLPTYQWSLNGFEIYGAVDDSVQITSIDPDHGGRYTVAVTIDGVTAYFSGYVFTSGTKPSTPCEIRTYNSRSDTSNLARLTDESGAVLAEIMLPTTPALHVTLDMTTTKVAYNYLFSINAAKFSSVRPLMPATFTITLPDTDSAGNANGKNVSIEISSDIIGQFGASAENKDYYFYLEITRGKTTTATKSMLDGAFSYDKVGAFYGVSYYLKNSNNTHTETPLYMGTSKIHLTIPALPGKNAVVFTYAGIRTGSVPFTRTGDSISFPANNTMNYALITSAVKFDDIAVHWAKDDIEKAAASLLVNGVGNSLYKPESALTRAQYCAMLIRAIGFNAPYVSDSRLPFGDIKTSDWYYPYVALAYDNGMLDFISGDRFLPNEPLTREEMAYMTYRSGVFGTNSMTLSNIDEMFGDTGEIETMYRNAVTACVSTGILVGTGTNFSPKSPYTRAQAAVVLNRVFEYMNDNLR